MSLAGPNGKKEEGGSGADGRASVAFSVGDFVIDRDTRTLSRDRQRVDIQRRPFDVLVYLASRHHRVVTREELLAEFWPRAVNDEALTRCISTLRKALGDIGDSPHYVETAWGQGYRCVAPVAEVPPTERAPSLAGSPATRRRWWLPAMAGILIVLVVTLLALRQPGPPPAPAIDALAVLPIVATGVEDWVATTMTDHLVETLARIEGIRVVARGSTAGFSAESDPVEIGAQLDVDAVLTSRLSGEGDTTKLTSRLLSTVDGSVLWSFRTPPAAGGEERQVVELAGAVARQLWANLQLREAERRVDPVAYRHYLRGRYYWNQRSPDSMAAAIESFEAALAREADYVDALVGLADSWLLMPLYGAMPPTTALPRAREAAERALSIDPEQAHAHAVIGVIAMQYDWDWPRAETQLRRAITLNPNDATAIQWLGELYCYRRQFDECRRHYQLAQGLDPLSPVIRMLQGSPALYSGDYATAISIYRDVRMELPEFRFTLLALGHAYVGERSWNEAISSYEAALPELGLKIVGGPLVHALGRDGQGDRAEALLTELESLARRRYVPPTRLAIAHIGLGNRADALNALRKAVTVRDERLVYLGVDPFYHELHDDPAFRVIATDVGLQDVIDAQ